MANFSINAVASLLRVQRSDTSLNQPEQEISQDPGLFLDLSEQVADKIGDIESGIIRLGKSQDKTKENISDISRSYKKLQDNYVKIVSNLEEKNSNEKGILAIRKRIARITENRLRQLKALEAEARAEQTRNAAGTLEVPPVFGDLNLPRLRRKKRRRQRQPAPVTVPVPAPAPVQEKVPEQQPELVPTVPKRKPWWERLPDLQLPDIEFPDLPPIIPPLIPRLPQIAFDDIQRMGSEAIQGMGDNIVKGFTDPTPLSEIIPGFEQASNLLGVDPSQLESSIETTMMLTGGGASGYVSKVPSLGSRLPQLSTLGSRFRNVFSGLSRQTSGGSAIRTAASKRFAARQLQASRLNKARETLLGNRSASIKTAASKRRAARLAASQRRVDRIRSAQDQTALLKAKQENFKIFKVGGRGTKPIKKITGGSREIQVKDETILEQLGRAVQNAERGGDYAQARRIQKEIDRYLIKNTIPKTPIKQSSGGIIAGEAGNEIVYPLTSSVGRNVMKNLGGGSNMLSTIGPLLSASAGIAKHPAYNDVIGPTVNPIVEPLLAQYNVPKYSTNLGVINASRVSSVSKQKPEKEDGGIFGGIIDFFKGLFGGGKDDTVQPLLTPPPPVPSSGGGSSVSGKWGPLLSLIASKESSGNYEAMYPNTTLPGATRMTISEVARVATGAVGMYQQLPEYLVDRAARINLDPDKDLYSPANQDLIASKVNIVNRGGNDWLAGKMSTEEFMDGLAYEWTALPKSDGSFAYAGQSSSITPADVRGALDGVKSGSSPQSPASSQHSAGSTKQHQGPVIQAAPGGSAGGAAPAAPVLRAASEAPPTPIPVSPNLETAMSGGGIQYVPVPVGTNMQIASTGDGDISRRGGSSSGLTIADIYKIKLLNT